MAVVREVDVATTLTPKFTVSLEKEQSPLTKALIEFLKPTFVIRSQVGDYTYAPYGESEGSWIIPVVLFGLVVMAFRGK